MNRTIFGFPSNYKVRKYILMGEEGGV